MWGSGGRVVCAGAEGVERVRGMTKRAKWRVVAGVAGLVLVALGLTVMARGVGPRLRAEVVRGLAEQLDSDVTLDALDVRWFPQPAVWGRGLVVRHKGRTDIPPLVSVEAFSGTTGWRSAFGRRVRRVTVDGLEITIPPGRRADMPSIAIGEDEAGEPPFTIDQVVATNARLSILPRDPDKNPRVFDIFSLQVRDLTFVSPSTFEAAIANPVPFGRVEAHGSFGPWARVEPGATPVEGQFTFNADLGTIKGIAGALEAEGTFSGPLARLGVSGTTKTPDFRIPRLRAAALPLANRFEAVVDGTNGDIELVRVESSLADSHFVSSGRIVGTRGVKGKRVVLDVESDDARMEDLLRLTVRSNPPPMSGQVTLATDFDLPPGEGDVLDRLRLSGTVKIASARFSSDVVQDKVDELSRRGRGRPDDESIENVASNLSTRFELTDAVVVLRGLTYSVRGASVALGGTYALESGALDFAGAARLTASASQTQTGLRHFLLKPFDPLLRKGGAGTRLAIKVTGTIDEPDFGVEIGRTLTGR